MFEHRTDINDLFSKWDELSSYTLGFWLADGSIYLNKPRPTQCYKAWELCNTNREGLQFICDQIGYQNRLWLKKKQQPHHKQRYYCRVHSDTLFDFCYSITATIYKSHTEVMIPAIPTELVRHFVRGFFDGDGSIHYATYLNRHKKQTSELRTSFHAGRQTGEFLASLRDLIRTQIPVGLRKICGKHSKSLRFGQYDSSLLCEWMYRDCSIAFSNKRLIWQEADHNRIAKSTKFFSNKV